MSHQTGIKANEKLKKFFTSYLDLNVRVFKVSIENEELTLVQHEKVNGAWNEDFDVLVPPLVHPQQPAYILYRLDSKDEMTGFDWLLISWSPDESHVRQKMLYASTKATLKQEFGSGQIKEEYHATTMDDISLKSLERHRLTVKAPAPLTMREEELVELRKSEATGLTEISVDSRSQTLSGVAFPLLPDGLTAVKKLASKEVNYAQFKIDDNDKSLSLLNSLPSINTAVETDPVLKTCQLKILIPIDKLKQSVSFSCELASASENLYESEAFSVIERHIFSLDKEDINDMTSHPVSPSTPITLLNPQSWCTDGTLNLTSESASDVEVENVVLNSTTTSDENVVLLSQNSTLNHYLDSPKVVTSGNLSKETSDSGNILKSKPSTSTNLKRKSEISSTSKKESIKKRRTVPKESVQERRTEPESHGICANKPNYKSTASRSNKFSSTLDKFFEECPSHLNNTNAKSVSSFCENILEITLQAKARGESLSFDLPETLTRINILSNLLSMDPLIDDEQNFVSKNAFDLVMVSADVVYIILTVFSENLSSSLNVVSLIAKFVYNHFFHSVQPVTQTRDNNKLTKAEFNKTFGSDSFSSLMHRLELIILSFSEYSKIVGASKDSFSKLAAVCISSFFTPHCLNFQHACLKLITCFFCNFEDHRPLILDQIISTIALLNAESDFVQKGFKIEQKDVKIQFITAALLRFICGSVNYLSNAISASEIKKSYPIKRKQIEQLFVEFYNKLIVNSASNSNFKSVLGNMIQDMLKIRVEPEWPSSNFVFKYLSNLMAFTLKDSKSEKLVKIACFDFLIYILPVFRRDFLSTSSVLNSLHEIVSAVSQKDSPKKKTDASIIIHSDAVCCLKLLIQILAGRKSADNDSSVQIYCHILLEELERNLQKLKGNASKLKSAQKDLDSIFLFVFDIVKRLKSTETQGHKSKLVVLSNKDQEIIKTVCRYLRSSDPFANYSDRHLKLVIMNVCQSAPQVQSKAIKCLVSVLTVDPNLLLFKDVEIAIKRCLTHKSSETRHKVIDFLGSKIFSDQEIFEKYFECVADRILDVSLTVRKTALTIMCKLCLDSPSYPKMSDVYVKILRRLTDEQQVMKVTLNLFKNKWIDAVVTMDSNHISPVISEMLLILKLANNNNAGKCLLILFKGLVNNGESKTESLVAFKKIVKGIISAIDETSLDSQSLINSYFLLNIISSSSTELAEALTPFLYPFLRLKLESEENDVIQVFILQTFELLLFKCSSFFMDKEKKSSLTQLFLSKMNAGNYRVFIISLSCFSLISKINKDLSSAIKTFLLYHNRLKAYSNHPTQISNENNPLPRIILNLGGLIKYFSFSKLEASAFDYSLVIETNQMLIDLLQKDGENQVQIVKALALIFGRFNSLLLSDKVVSLFTEFLMNSKFSSDLKVQVLLTINSYWEEDNERCKLLNEKWKETSKTEDLKMMNDVSAGKPSVVAQKYLPSILKCCLAKDTRVRIAAVRAVTTIANLNLLYPTHFLPYTVCFLADPENAIAYTAFKTLVNYEAEHSNLVRSVCMEGILLSFELLKEISPQPDVIRGFISIQDIPQSRFSKLSEIYKQSKAKSIIFTSIINQFNNSNRSKTNLSLLLYLADNLAYFPYKENQEVLSILYQISTLVSNDAAHLFDQIKDLLSKNRKIVRLKAADESAYDSHPVSNEGKSSSRSKKKTVRVSTDNLPALCESSYRYILLLQLWHFLKSLYKVSDKCLLSYQEKSSSGLKKAVSKNAQMNLFNPESAIHFLQFCAQSGFDDKENLASTPFLDILRSSSTEFEGLLSKLNSECPQNPVEDTETVVISS